MKTTRRWWDIPCLRTLVSGGEGNTIDNPTPPYALTTSKRILNILNHRIVNARKQVKAGGGYVIISILNLI